MFLPRKEKNKILPFIQCSITFAPRLQRRLTSEYLLKERGNRIMFHAFYFNSLHSMNTSPNHQLLRTHSTERHSQVNRNRAFSHCKFAVHSTQILLDYQSLSTWTCNFIYSTNFIEWQYIRLWYTSFLMEFC